MTSTPSNVLVGTSPIHGRGLFARDFISEGTVLGYCDVKPTNTPCLYTLTIDDHQLFEVTCCFKYINHGRPSNVAYYDDFSVVALHDIEAGEELLHDYGEDW